MINVKLQSTAIVVLSAGNNPRLLNGDFLKRNRIVPEEWVIIDTLVTPPVSQVTFENGMQFLVEENRLHFRVNQPVDFPWVEKLPQATLEYMQLLSHVNYGGVGLNFVYTSDDPSGDAAQQAIIRRLMKAGAWLKCNSGISGAVLDLQYRREQPSMNVKIGVRESVGPQGKKLEGLIFTVNFHQEFQATQEEERASYVQSIGARQAQFFRFIEMLPF